MPIKRLKIMGMLLSIMGVLLLMVNPWSAEAYESTMSQTRTSRIIFDINPDQSYISSPHETWVCVNGFENNWHVKDTLTFVKFDPSSGDLTKICFEASADISPREQFTSLRSPSGHDDTIIRIYNFVDFGPQNHPNIYFSLKTANLRHLQNIYMRNEIHGSNLRIAGFDINLDPDDNYVLYEESKDEPVPSTSDTICYVDPKILADFTGRGYVELPEGAIHYEDLSGLHIIHEEVGEYIVGNRPVSRTIEMNFNLDPIKFHAGGEFHEDCGPCFGTCYCPTVVADISNTEIFTVWAKGTLNYEATIIYYYDAPIASGGTNISDADEDHYASDIDCNDHDPTVNPGAIELCNVIDDNCNGSIDEGCTTYYLDADKDGYGDPNVSVIETSQPADYVTNNGDCDDSEASVNPAVTEVCDGFDNDCNGVVDDRMPDFDGDRLCDSIDPDDDNDSIEDSDDSAPLDPNICANTDGDLCDDCASGTFDPNNDGYDFDGDGLCDAAFNPFCGDGLCDVTEGCASCEVDCGQCSTPCGNGICDTEENCITCSIDCGFCIDNCGNNVCDTRENCVNCPLDCGRCQSVCGDNICQITEDCATCPNDCGICPLNCGDGRCFHGEDCSTCPIDCGRCPAICGNGTCEPGEDCIACASDCGDCLPTCGNNICEAGEHCVNCPLDCGDCPTVCGDGACEQNEDCLSCEADCGICPAGCGNGICSPSESCSTCSVDCGKCAPVCGDGSCVASENCMSCPLDCGACAVNCGDSVCDVGEHCVNCPADCGSCPVFCGNGICEPGEDCRTCASDCGPCTPNCGNGLCDGNENCIKCPDDCGTCP